MSWATASLVVLGFVSLLLLPRGIWASDSDTGLDSGSPQQKSANRSVGRSPAVFLEVKNASAAPEFAFIGSQFVLRLSSLGLVLESKGPTAPYIRLSDNMSNTRYPTDGLVQESESVNMRLVYLNI